MSSKAALVLSVVSSDRTFEQTEVRGLRVWVGKCIHCGARLVVGLDGNCGGLTTLEHIVPKCHGGTDDVENLALACRRCNTQKGVRQDVRRRGDPKLEAVIETLRARRLARLRR